MKNSARVGGIALVVFALAFFTFFALEMSRSSLGFEDADNPSVSIEFLKNHSNVYMLSGLASVLASLALGLGALATAEVAEGQSHTLALKYITVFGLFSAALFFGQGILRVVAPGTLLHMDGLNHDFGVAGYLAVQMAGTQGFGTAGGFALSIWALGICLLRVRSRVFPLALSLLGVVPATHLLIGLLGPLLDLPESFYLIYVTSIFGVMLWCFLLGTSLLRWRAA